MLTGERNGTRLHPAGKSNTARYPKILSIYRNALSHQGKDPLRTVRCTDLFRNQQWAEYPIPRTLYREMNILDRGVLFLVLSPLSFDLIPHTPHPIPHTQYRYSLHAVRCSTRILRPILSLFSQGPPTPFYPREGIRFEKGFSGVTSTFSIHNSAFL